MPKLQFITTIGQQDIYGYPVSLIKRETDDYGTVYSVVAEGSEYNLSDQSNDTEKHDRVITFKGAAYVVPCIPNSDEWNSMNHALVSAGAAFEIDKNVGFGKVTKGFREGFSKGELELDVQLKAAKAAKAPAAAASSSSSAAAGANGMPLTAQAVNLDADPSTHVPPMKKKKAVSLGKDNFRRPNWNLTATAIGAATAGTAGAAVNGGPVFASLVGHKIAASVLGGVLLAPAVSFVAAYGLTYMFARAQCAAQNGTWNISPANHQIIRNNSWNSAQQLAGAFLGAELGRQVIERSVEAVMSQFVSNASSQLLGALGSFTTNVAGLGSIELKGAVMLFTAIGLGFGLMGTLMYQNHRDHKKHDPAQYLNAFFIGAAIGAAASIGYGNEVASYLMPLATTAGLLMLMPHTQKPVETARAIGEGLSKAGDSCKYAYRKQRLQAGAGLHYVDGNANTDSGKTAFKYNAV